ncbi:CD209 antigen-like protein C isoform X2 [Dendropsophus ebraccatus]|uniref:CD209 antigen-like protein C isoform X2 n=1 Tax=Dendropsophus ebraccatus TaxID=150705 RepID=UPI003831B407
MRKNTLTEEDVYVNFEELNKERKLIKSVGKDKTGKSKDFSTANIKKKQVILAALILLIILFLISIAITSLLLQYYLSMSEEMSHMKNHTGDQLRMTLEDMQTHLDNVKQRFLQDVKSINKTLESICPVWLGGWSWIGSSCYYVSEEKTTWDEARDKCYQMNSILVMVKDKAESETLNKLYKGQRRYWIGLRRDPENIQTWRWLDGTKVTYSNWINNQPDNYQNNEHCAETKSGPWNDIHCTEKLDYICKK